MSASITGVVLGLDTATADVAVAATREEHVLFEAQIAPAPAGRPNHSSTLLAAVASAVRASGGWEEVELIAVGVGPGAFTGLRVGIATARALAQARGLGLVGVGSLAALARGIGEQRGEGGEGRPLLSLIDARRGGVFAALFDPSGAELWEPFVAAPQELVARMASLAAAPVAAGDGSLRFRAELEAAGAEVPPDADPAHRLSARHICALAGGVSRGRPEDVRPIYLRRPDAELWREQQRGARD